MRGVVAGLALALMASGAGAQQGLSPVAQAAAKVYMDCMHATAEKVDDGRSDAGSIAIGVVAFCRVHQRPLAIAMSAGSPEMQQVMQQEIEQRALQTATGFVLAVRTFRRNSARPAMPRPKPKPKGETI
ncbi:hypothetical protein [Rhodopseudomonas sp. RCAM05734]|uniref:hypothetical protein n=1 Tax=Rhodopseudomonas sp. RCAM05734 TaxID=3457549 RepID=UPI004044EED2